MVNDQTQSVNSAIADQLTESELRNAEYIGEMASELRKIASDNNMDFLVYILDMAVAEANSILRANPSETGSPNPKKFKAWATAQSL